METKLGMTTFAFLIALGGCAGERVIGASQERLAGALDETKGWHCYNSPNTIDVPGMVFRVNNAGVKYRTVNLSGRIPAEPISFADATFSDRNQVDASLLANLLRIPMVESGAAAIDAGAGSKYSIEYILRERTGRTTYDEDLTPLFEWFRSYDRYDPNERYYFIRDTMEAKEITYNIDRNVEAAFGGEASFKNLLEVKPGVSVAKQTVYTISQKFDEPHIVCIKPMELARDPGGALGVGGVDAEIMLKEVPATEEPIFTTEAPS